MELIDFGEKIENKSSGNQKLFYSIVKNLLQEKKQPSVEVRNKEGELLDKKEHINRRWKAYSMELLGGKENNTKGEEGRDEDRRITSRDEVAEEQITNGEIVEAITKMKNGTATGCDGMNTEI
ncbi:hypothetical protein HHI36_015464 [Cryptolaemus montrouzieri]|uniref:Uncharacterized protein n=1 Tax=Cryptolaemus montrouzieri TaxID=559131 RepID=A0ABD2N5R2_9CUCU